ncbi:MAG TPA: CoA pyrophosphatase [Patescibacteria group bacterium]|nr:CoA pyrophosphatase [Patescibacteria group bacterium]
MIFNKFTTFLKNRLHNELPGLEIQKIMAPLRNGEVMRALKAPPTARRSAVLVLLFKNNDKYSPNILFTLRSAGLRSHKGQISFPGGHIEPDEKDAEAALREAWEETALLKENVEILGNLTELYVPPSNSIITPVVGFTENIGNLQPSEAEVEEIFSVNIEDFLNGNSFKKEWWEIDGVRVEVPLWRIHATTPLWGATAMMLRELLYLYEEFLQTEEDNAF